MYNTYGALSDVATFSTTTYQTSVSGQETKVQSVLYSDIPCKIRNPKSRVSKEGAEEVFGDTYRVIVTKEYNGANRGDTITISGETFVIMRKLEKKDGLETISVKYLCELFQ